jgi:hypothetical protein
MKARSLLSAALLTMGLIGSAAVITPKSERGFLGDINQSR